MISASSAFTNANNVLAKKPIHLIEIDGYDIVFTNRITGIAGQRSLIESIEDHSITINDLDGGADLGEFIFTVQDRDDVITASFPTFVFEGKRVTVKTGFTGMSQADFVICFTGEVDAVDSVNANNSYQFTCVDNKRILNKVIYDVADDGFPTSNDHIKTLNAHPLDLLLDILINKLEIAEEDINVAKIETYRDGIFSGTQFKFAIDSPPSAKEFIEQQLLKPLMGYIWTNNLGQLDVNFIYPNSVASVFDFDEDLIYEIPEAQQIDLINVASFRFDKSDDGKFLSEVVQEDGDSIDRYGQYGQQVIESEGMRSGLQGYFVSAISARMMFQRYGLKALKFDPLHALWKAIILEPGDLVSVTHSKVPDRALGVRGITSKKFVVLDRLWNFREGRVDLLLVDATYLTNFGFYKITTDGFPDFTAATTEQKDTYMFLCDDSDQYSDTTAAHALG